MGNNQSEPSNILDAPENISEENIEKQMMKIKFRDIERLHYFFQSNYKELSSENTGLWFYFLCVRPDYTNLVIDNYETQGFKKNTQIFYPYRFINYLYDIEWSEKIDKITLEEMKNKVRFWITDDACDTWESLCKISY